MPSIHSPAAAARGGPEYIEAVEAAGRAVPLDPFQTVAYGPHEGQAFDVYRPAGAAPAGGWPVLLFFHGGAWIRGGRHWLRFMAPAVNSLPAILVAGTYRLAPASRWPAPYEDVCDAIREVHRSAAGWGGDPQRIAVAGHSAGGHLAAMAVLKREIPPLLACLPVSSPCDLRYGEVPDGSDEARVYKFLLQHREQDAEASPVLFTAGNRVPFHLVWGTGDFERIRRSSLALVQALQAQGSPVTYAAVQGAGHFQTHLMLGNAANGWYDVLRSLFASGVAQGDFPAIRSPAAGSATA